MKSLRTSTYRKLDFIVSIVHLVIVIGLVYLYFRYLFWPTAPFVFSFIIAMMLQKPLRAIDRKMKSKKWHTFFSILFVVLLLLIVLGPIALLLSLIINQVSDFVSSLIAQFNDLPSLLGDVRNWVLDTLRFLPDSVYNDLASSLNELITKVQNGISLSEMNIDTSAIRNGITSGIGGIYNVARNIPSALIGIVIGVIATIYFTKDYTIVTKAIVRQLPESKKTLLPEIKHIFSTTVLKLIRSYGLIMLITFTELCISFYVMHLAGVLNTNFIPLIALGIAVFDILPVAGTGGILIPWIIISLFLGNYRLAIGLLITYALISVIRQYIEPKIVGTSLGVHPLITLASMYFGLKLFGFLGIIVMPLCIMTVKAFNDSGRIHIYKPARRN